MRYHRVLDSTLAAPDSVTLTLDRIEDWLCALDDRAYGGYSVQVLRSRMSDHEREAHDQAWGLMFPAPDTVQLPDRSAEFEENVLAQLKEQIESEPGCIAEDYGEGPSDGLTLLRHVHENGPQTPDLASCRMATMMI